MIELTPEERQKIYEEEKAKKDEALQIHWVIVALSTGTIALFAVLVWWSYTAVVGPTWEAERKHKEHIAALEKRHSETKALLHELAELAEKQGHVKVLSSNWYEEGEWFYYEGEIENTGKQPIDTVEAVASFYSDDGKFIKSDSALIEYSPLMPGQSSPFKVMGRYHPLVRKAGIAFKDFRTGAQIAQE